MRVIAGIYRSRPLASPRGDATRPTSDRLRETLFNILAPRIAGARFADLYSGTGAVGIEALSRGAAHVLFTERDPAALLTLRANLASLALTRNLTLDSRPTQTVLERLLTAPEPPFDLVFLDPPYTAAAEYTAALTLLGSPRGQRLLAPDALVIAEHATRNPLPAHIGALTQTRTRTQGDATLSFYAAQPADPAAIP